MPPVDKTVQSSLGASNEWTYRKMRKWAVGVRSVSREYALLGAIGSAQKGSSNRQRCRSARFVRGVSESPNPSRVAKLNRLIQELRYSLSRKVWKYVKSFSGNSEKEKFVNSIEKNMGLTLRWQNSRRFDWIVYKIGGRKWYPQCDVSGASSGLWLFLYRTYWAGQATLELDADWRGFHLSEMCRWESCGSRMSWRVRWLQPMKLRYKQGGRDFKEWFVYLTRHILLFMLVELIGSERNIKNLSLDCSYTSSKRAKADSSENSRLRRVRKVQIHDPTDEDRIVNPHATPWVTSRLVSW